MLKHFNKSLFILFIASIFCLLVIKIEAKPNIKKQPFGKTNDGVAVDIYTLTNSKGAEARITNYGGRVVSLKTPDRKGKFADILLGYDT